MLKLYAWLKRMVYRISYAVQRIQLIILSLIMLGVVEYFAFYEVFVTLLTFAPLAAAELLPLFLAVILTIAAWKGVKRLRKKLGKDKSFSLL